MNDPLERDRRESRAAALDEYREAVGRFGESVPTAVGADDFELVEVADGTFVAVDSTKKRSAA